MLRPFLGIIVFVFVVLLLVAFDEHYALDYVSNDSFSIFFHDSTSLNATRMLHEASRKFQN